MSRFLSIWIGIVLLAGCGAPDPEERVTLDEGLADSGVSPIESGEFIRGAEVFVEYCAACHREDGTGIGKIYPPLMGADFLDDKDQTVGAVVNGLVGELEVNGTTYNAMMPPLPRTYSDEDASEVINFVIANFGDGSWETTPKEVSSVRK